MASFASDDPFDFDDSSDGAEFSYDPFDCVDWDDGDDGGELCVSAFAFPDGDDGGEFCISGIAFPDGDDNLVVEDHASQVPHEEPDLETLGCSFDPDEGLGLLMPELVSALNFDTSEEEAAGDGGDAAEFILDGLYREPGLAIGEDTDRDGNDGLGFMHSGSDLDPRPLTGGFQTLVDADDGWDVDASHDDGWDVDAGHDDGWNVAATHYDMNEETEVDLRLPAFRMLVDDTYSDDDSDIIDGLVLRITDAWAHSRRLPASRLAVEALPEVAPSEEEASSGCAVCKDDIAAGQLVVRLPCKHFFHGDCIRPWLAIRNTCPVCRYELPTGDADYDRQRRIAAGASTVQHGTTAQSRTVGAEDATGCTGENRLEQSAS